MSTGIEDIRTNTLQQIDRAERHYKLAFVGAAIVEVLFFAAFVLLADFSNRIHVLLLLTAVAVYTLVTTGLIALGLHVNRAALRIIKAVETLK